LLQSVPERDEWNAIDSNIVTDKQGTPWMAFGSFWNGIKLVKLNADWKTIAEPQEWHSLARRAPLPPRAGEFKPAPEEIEAPFIFQRGNDYFLFVSWGLCCQKEKSTYHLAVGRSKSVTGPYLDKDGRDMAQGGGTVVLKGDKD
ncbi:MAG: family 43 glycosylhydrolase, partial [Janthinobacterium sp.]